MKKHFYIIIAVIILAISAGAHPLGNFSVNQYSRLTVEKSQIKIRQILDLAEIPTFQTQSAIDTDKDGKMSEAELKIYAENIAPQMLEKLFLTVNEKRLNLQIEKKNIRLNSGEGNLPTLRLELDLSAKFENTPEISRVKFENKNHTERVGWNEIVISRAGGIEVFDSTAAGSGVTDEIKTYPQETLDAPLSERTAEFSFTSANTTPANSQPLKNRDGHLTAAVPQKDKLAELIAVPEITFSIAVFGLFLAFGLGAMHAMSPGHGKAVVGAYLIGSRGTPKHAAFLGLTVTITHTLGVFALGIVTLFASNYILPEKLMPFLSFISGLLVLYIGLTMFHKRLFSILGWEKAEHHHHHHHEHTHHHGEHHHHHGEHSDEHHHHDHTHHHAHDAFIHTHDGHTHSHLPPDEISWKSLLALGVSGGLLPCPSALVLMLSAISLGRVGYGLILTIAFSLGLAATLTAVGLIFLYLGKSFGGSRFAENRILKSLPVASAFLIACIGAVICYNSFA